jgi:iron-sulfur cluster repair protein YtfE (RIC family)
VTKVIGTNLFLRSLRNIKRDLKLERGRLETSMNMTAERTVRELALENTAATSVFEKLGIDYCCGGDKSLEDACRASNLSVDQVIDFLEMAEEAAHATQKDRNWQIEPLADLITHQEHPPQIHA